MASQRQNKMFAKSKRGYVQHKHPFAVTSCGRRRSRLSSRKNKVK